MKRKEVRSLFYSFPMGAWFTVFFVVPLLIIASYSFMKKGLYGGVVFERSFYAYVQLWSADYGILFFRTLWISVLVTFLCIVIAQAVFKGY